MSIWMSTQRVIVNKDIANSCTKSERQEGELWKKKSQKFEVWTQTLNLWSSDRFRIQTVLLTRCFFWDGKLWNMPLHVQSWKVGDPRRIRISDLPYVLYPCHTCILHVPPTGNSENSKYVSILSGNFILLTGVSVIPDNFTLWEAKGKLVNIKAIPFWSINKLNGQARQPSVELLSQGTWWDHLHLILPVLWVRARGPGLLCVVRIYCLKKGLSFSCHHPEQTGCYQRLLRKMTL